MTQEKKQYFFAADLGATSGRTILGTLADGKLEMEELSRFENRLIAVGEYVYWDIYALYDEIVKGLRLAARRKITLTSIGVDTWGVDFVCVGADGALMRNPLAYRDPHSFAAMEAYFDEQLSRKELYAATGIQFVNYNSIFQLYGMRRCGDSALASAHKILFMPDAISYLLSGKMVCEYSIASTSQLLNATTHQLDEKVLGTLNLRKDQFGAMVLPGTVIGTLTASLQEQTGLGPVPVVAVAGHDTASAVAAIPASEPGFAYLSSGTWSLMGIESPHGIVSEESYKANFTNEGGVDGTIRFLKNICGMWLYESCRREWPELQSVSHTELQSMALESEPFMSFIDPDDQCFANPRSMVSAIQIYCKEHGERVPETPAQICRCIFESLALRYREVFDSLKTLSPFNIGNTLHVIGGGSKNEVLNQFTANSLNVRVLAGPQECTAMGNLMLQAKAVGAVQDVWDMRKKIAQGLTLKEFLPQDKEMWDGAYQKYRQVTGTGAL